MISFFKIVPYSKNLISFIEIMQRNTYYTILL